jgi:uroporphyrinogen decarboxylase
MNLTPKENLLQVIKHQSPEYVPFDLESVVEVSHMDSKFFSQNGNPDLMEWQDAWGVDFKLGDPNDHLSGYPIGHPLTSFDVMKSFKWPDPGKADLMDEVKEIISNNDREVTLFMGRSPAVLFVRSWLLMGMNELLMNMILDEAKVEELLDKILAYQLKIVERYIDCGVDILHFGDDAGTTAALMMNPDIWRRLIKPRLKTIFDLCKKTNKFVYFHCCGNIMEIIDDIIEIGADILNPIQAGANNLEFIRAKTAGKVVLHGGIDTHTVYTADFKTIAELTEKSLALLAKEGDYIAYADQNLVFPSKNIEVMKKVVREKGIYKNKTLNI